ncbi:hypothetical protein GGQ65_002857 [Rhizobium fabae]|uniref:Uncharacterized protein n=1 Tax=Rhizobium fabae TaxID=573179 RepID=A0A7W6B4Q4_9HYPH|nr:hypothetical protein [Rhizobium fabae]
MDRIRFIPLVYQSRAWASIDRRVAGGEHE